MKEKIFVQIASYRDPELLPTLDDLLKKAKYPERLTFGICWQHSEEDEWDTLDKFIDNPAFTIMDVPWNESKGLCWARHHIQKMYQGEEYTLQLDSHHRFIQDWDDELINMMKLTESDKPIITSYAGMYSPADNSLLNNEPYKMVANRFTSGGTILFYPHVIPNWEKLKKPIPARFVSGHFFFTLGEHCKEYKYDPHLYFAGDEISLSIRSFTLGYDLFHPHKTVVWHEYTREGRIKHWDDFQQKNADKIEKTFTELDDISKKRLRQLLREEDHGIDLFEYDLGNVRTHKDYENYSGIDFKNRVLHSYTKEGKEPPTIIDTEDNKWRYMKSNINNIQLDWTNYWDDIRKQISCTCNFDFIYCGIESEDGTVLYRKDLKEKEYLNGRFTSLNVSFESFKKPTKFVLWPHQKDGDWLNRIDITKLNLISAT